MEQEPITTTEIIPSSRPLQFSSNKPNSVTWIQIQILSLLSNRCQGNQMSNMDNPTRANHLHITITCNIKCRCVKWAPCRPLPVETTPWIGTTFISVINRVTLARVCSILTQRSNRWSFKVSHQTLIQSSPVCQRCDLRSLSIREWMISRRRPRLWSKIEWSTKTNTISMTFLKIILPQPSPIIITWEVSYLLFSLRVHRTSSSTMLLMLISV